MSKVDPSTLKGLDRKSTILLQASRQHTEKNDKGDISGIEEPGMDALRGSFGALGSIIRARSISQTSSIRSPPIGHRRGRGGSSELGSSELTTHGLANLSRTQLYDAPVPRGAPSTSGHGHLPPLDEESSLESSGSRQLAPPITSEPPLSPRKQAIKFDSSEVMHYYPDQGRSGNAVHGRRNMDIGRRATEDAFDPSHFPSRSNDSTTSNDPFVGGPGRNDSDPFRDTPNPSQINLLSRDSRDSGRDSADNLLYDDHEMDTVTSPEDLRKPFHVRGRAYPGGSRSDEEEEENARESLVAHDSGSTRGGIRLIPPKSPRKI